MKNERMGLLVSPSVHYDLSVIYAVLLADDVEFVALREALKRRLAGQVMGRKLPAPAGIAVGIGLAAFFLIAVSSRALRLSSDTIKMQDAGRKHLRGL